MAKYHQFPSNTSRGLGRGENVQAPEPTKARAAVRREKYQMGGYTGVYRMHDKNHAERLCVLLQKYTHTQTITHACVCINNALLHAPKPKAWSRTGWRELLRVYFTTLLQHWATGRIAW